MQPSKIEYVYRAGILFSRMVSLFCCLSPHTTPATHLTDGIETFTCSCGDTYTKPVEKLEGHTYNTVVTAPTCTEQGYTTYTCACGDSYISDYVEEKGHSYTSSITTPATHLTEGAETFTCSCGDTYTMPVAKLEGHTYNTVVTAPTCTAQGYTTYNCACGDSYIADYTDVVDHIDADGDYLCGYNCGYAFEKPVEPENPDNSENPDFPKLPEFELPEIELPEISENTGNCVFSSFFAKLMILLTQIGKLLSSISIIT